MMKTSAMFSAHAIHVLVRNTLIFFIVLFIALFAWLSVGIKIDTLKVSSYRVDGLYLKLDKKLILKADKIMIPKRKDNPSFDRIDETLGRIKYVLTFFEKIDLKKIVFENNILDIYFYNNILQLSSNDYLIRGNVHREGKMLKGDIPIFQLKKQHITMRGHFSYDLHKDILTTEGKFLFHKASGDFNASKIKSKVIFALKSETFSDLKSLVSPFSMSPAVQSWVVDKVRAKHYKLLSLTGKGNIENKVFQMDWEQLKAKVLFSDVTIDFKKELYPVLAPSFVLSYNYDGGLFFDLKHPRYRGKNLEGSTVSIVNLGEDNTTLKLNFKFDTTFDAQVQDILKAYDITVPVIQKNGKSKASLNIDIGLKKPRHRVLFDVHVMTSDVYIKKLHLPVKKGDLHYEKKKLTFKNVLLSNSEYRGLLNGTLDIPKSNANFVFDAEHITFKTQGKTLFHCKKERIPFQLKYKKFLAINIPKFKVTLTNEQNETVLNMNDLSKVKLYLSDAIPIEEGGILEIKTKQFKTFDFKGVLKRSSCFFYENNETCKARVPFYGKATYDNVEFYAFGDRFYYNQKKSRVKLKNLNIDLQKFLAHNKKETTNNKQKKSKKKTKNLVILGKNSNLRYGAYRLLTDSYDVEIKPNGDIKAIGSNDGDIVKFTKVNDIITLKALRIKDKVLHPLINFDGLKHGRYSITNKGDLEKTMKGKIIVEGGVMKGFKAYNNTLAFINTIPALATLHKPGYSVKGFIIESGVVEYRMVHSTKILFDSIYIKGNSATIVGKGEVDLKKKTIHIELGIQVARELGKVVGSIPLVGYILVGKDKSVTVGLQITGTLEKPVVSVSAAKDILSYPLEIIKRTIEAPQQLLAPEKK